MIPQFTAIDGQLVMPIEYTRATKRYECLVCGRVTVWPLYVQEYPKWDYLRAYRDEHRQQMKEKFDKMGASPDWLPGDRG